MLSVILRSGKRVPVSALNFTLSCDEVAAGAASLIASTDR